MMAMELRTPKEKNAGPIVPVLKLDRGKGYIVVKSHHVYAPEDVQACGEPHKEHLIPSGLQSFFRRDGHDASSGMTYTS